MKVKSRLLLATVAGMLAASTVGAAAQDTYDGPAFFKVTMSPPGGPHAEPEIVASGDGWEGYAGWTWIDVAVDAGDPRASGLLDLRRNGSNIDLRSGSLNIERVSSRLVNDQGAWVGDRTVTVRLPADGGPPTHVGALDRFVGQGAYEGLILELHSPGLSEQGREIWWGVIYPAEAIPESPDPIGS